MTETVRTHDSFYLKEDRKREPKEYFKFIVSVARDHLLRLERPAILDIGCATGDFLHYLRTLFPDSDLTGLDVMPALLARARQEVPDCRFVEANICDKRSLPDATYDAVFMSGVHSIFDDVHPWLENVVSLVDRSRNGKAFIFGIFNPEDVDVLVKARYANPGADTSWQAGWNCFSRTTIEQALGEMNVQSCSFRDWTIGIDIARHEGDPLRSWTFQYLDGTRGIVNGTMVLHRFALLEIAR